MFSAAPLPVIIRETRATLAYYAFRSQLRWPAESWLAFQLSSLSIQACLSMKQTKSKYKLKTPHSATEVLKLNYSNSERSKI